MNDDLFHFRSVWRVHAPLVTVWNTVGKLTDYPQWWPGIARVTLLTGHELPIAIGTKAAYEVRSPLYTLHYQTEIVSFQTGASIAVAAQGDLEGTGAWTFSQQPGMTEATFDWNVRLRPPFLRTVSHVPGAKSIMRFFHDRLMAKGEEGLQRILRERPE